MNDNRYILKSTSSLMLLTIFVKLFGIIKQSVIAYYFGTDSELDMFFIASDFILELGIVFFSALTINLVNLYLVEREISKKSANNIFTDTIFSFVILSIAVSLIISFFPGQIAKLLAPGATEQSLSSLILYLRLFCFTLACIAVSNICIAVLNTEKEFFPGKCVGLIQSATVILSCVLFYSRLGALSLIIGTLLFFVLQDIYLLIKVKKYVWFSKPQIFKNEKIKELVKLWIPLFLSNSVIQLNAMVDKAIATSLGEGYVSALSYGHFIFSSIHSIMIMSTCTVLLTYFSMYILENRVGELIKTFRNNISLMTFVMIPLTVLCVSESQYIVKILYGRGAFTELSVSLTNDALIGYAVGIVFVTVRDIIMQALYALKKNKTAMINGVIGVIFNIVLSIVLSKKIGIFGIAVADSIAYLIVAIIGCIEVKHEIKGIWDIKLFVDILPSLFFTLISIIPLLFIRCFIDIGSALNLILESGTFIICFVILLLITKNDSLKRIIAFVKK